MTDNFFISQPEKAAFYPAYRAIGPAASPTGTSVQNQQIPVIYADVTVEEEHRDELVITEHPVEQGAAISDHAFKRPSQVVIRAGWSTSSVRATGVTYPADIRRALLNLQASRLPFDLYTGKQAYNNMLIASLLTETRDGSEYSLLATIVCQQVILVSTKVTSAPESANWPQINNTIVRGYESVTPTASIDHRPGYAIQDPKTGKSLIPPTFME